MPEPQADGRLRSSSPSAAPCANDRHLRGAVATDDVTDVFVGENVPLDRPRRRLTALTSPRAILEVNVRNAQSGAPELVARVRLESGLAASKLNAYSVHQGEKIVRPSWPAVNFGENAKFSCARLARACAPQVGGW
jgi:hypothetical protein